MEFDIFTLLPLAVAVFVFWKLRSVLGTRNGTEKPPYDPPFHNNEQGHDVDAVHRDNVVTLPHAKRRRDDVDPALEKEAKLKEFSNDDTAVFNGLKKIVAHDPEFDVEQFINGAKMAYEMIVMAFADGDKRALKGLLSREVYENFAESIEGREKRNEKVKANFIGIENIKLQGADLVDDQAQMTVQFISQMVSATLNENDDIIEGDLNEVAEVVDIWTFSRSVKSRDPNWKLIATDG